MKTKTTLFLLLLSISAFSKHIVFLGDSNTALSYLDSSKNYSLPMDYRFSALIANPVSPYYINGLTSVNTAVGGAKTSDFLSHGKYFNNWKNHFGDIFIIAFGLNDAPKTIPQSPAQWAHMNREKNIFRNETLTLTRLIKQRNPNALIYLMTNVDVNYQGGHFQYNRNIIIDQFDNVYRDLARTVPMLRIIDVNWNLKNEIRRGNTDLRIRRSQRHILDSSEDHSPMAKRMGQRLWRTNIHYNINGSQTVAKILHHYLKRTAAE